MGSCNWKTRSRTMTRHCPIQWLQVDTSQVGAKGCGRSRFYINIHCYSEEKKPSQLGALFWEHRNFSLQLPENFSSHFLNANYVLCVHSWNQLQGKCHRNAFLTSTKISLISVVLNQGWFLILPPMECLSMSGVSFDCYDSYCGGGGQRCWQTSYTAQDSPSQQKIIWCQISIVPPFFIVIPTSHQSHPLSMPTSKYL